ncbi:MAG TPA: hypothetical protein VL400_17895 [Polyangiaceae bacterium]|jgi:hypothetical protein|nr:hypothetical protein [Polyangiaceae bacterium]
MASWSGWAAAALMLAAVLFPIVHRVRYGKRADLASIWVTSHFAIGLAAAGLAFLHPLAAVLDLGSPEAVSAGAFGLGAGGVAFVILLAHTGLGLKLRNPKLRTRPSSRRKHFGTAIAIVVAVTVHTVACLLGRAG